MTTYYDRAQQRLVMRQTAATPAFWDALWQTDDLKAQIERGASERFYTGLTRRFIPPSAKARILEGGCGQGLLVYALTKAGYGAYGVDFAPETIAAINRAMPQLNVRYGELSGLEFPDNYFDGYWSLGVIEHNYAGYEPVLTEMRRVLKVGGYLFITFPYLNPLRKFKVAVGTYAPHEATEVMPADFYQFILNDRQVKQDLAGLGFGLEYEQAVDGIKGLHDEVGILRGLLRPILRSAWRPAQMLGAGLSEATAPWAGHIKLLILRKL